MSGLRFLSMTVLKTVGSLFKTKSMMLLTIFASIQEADGLFWSKLAKMQLRLSKKPYTLQLLCNCYNNSISESSNQNLFDLHTLSLILMTMELDIKFS